MAKKVVFVAESAATGHELWVTDGTTAGTYLLTDIAPGTADSNPQYMTALGNGEIVFTARDGTHGYELWVTDGTSAGTHMVSDIYPGSGSSHPRDITALGNGKAVFKANDGIHGYELWVTDGSAAGTYLVKDIRPGSSGSGLTTDFTPLGNGTALFEANDGSHGYQLWITDGTSAGTSNLADVNFSGSYPSDITLLGNGKALFQGTDGTHGYELWVTNGTGAGTYMLDDINPGSASSKLSEITPLGNGKALFVATDGTHGYELWLTDGTSAGTSLVDDINPGSASSHIKYLTALGGGKALFRANDGSHGYELWVTNGSLAGTYMVTTFTSSLSDLPHEITPLGNGKAVFAADDSIHGLQLWVTDGTAAGTSMLTSTAYDFHGPYVTAAIGNGKALFAARDSIHGNQLWVTDGTTGGTQLLKTINPTGGSYPDSFFPLGNGQVLFDATDGTHGRELWITDGTAAGTSLVNDINPGTPSSYPTGFTLDPACYCSGTRIRTDRGQKRVENLKIGDRVKTASGETRPIKWIGRRSYGGRFIMGRNDILPICIKADALADNVPRRDLWISPNHALYLDGVLIEAKDLVNGVSIVRAEQAGKVEYFHIELETHDVVIAEGALSETYIDDDNRSIFHNAHEYAALYPDSVAKPARYCAPRLDEGHEVEAVRRRIAGRAGLRAQHDAPGSGTLRGYVDLVSPNCIAGWAQTVEHPEAPVCLDIYIGGRLISQVLANQFREDLRRAGLGSGRHSFAFAPPAGLSVLPDMVEVRRSSDGTALLRSAHAKMIRCRAVA